MPATRVIWALIIACVLCAGHENSARAEGNSAGNGTYVNYAALGRAKFTQHKYDEAIDLFRKHLRHNPKDYNVWNQLGAAYYHTGQPRKALRFLKHVERQTTDKSYNYYYQGLCYEAADQPDKAKEFFTYGAQKYSDEYASRATFEVATLEYNVHNKPRAQYWLSLYMQRYGTGVYAQRAGELLGSLRSGVWIPNVEGTKKPDMEEALYKYNKLSLSNHPHFWFVEGGWQYVDHAGQEPAPGGGIKPDDYQDMAALVDAGVGIGPIKQGDTTVTAGYTYNQIWNTDFDRINEWMDDPTDLEYFPLRGDELERHHSFYGDFRHDISGIFYYGAYARYEFDRIGSSLMPSPDQQDLRQVLKIADIQLLIPWIGFSYAGNMRTLAYLYFRKELDYDDSDFSNKTYDLGSAAGGSSSSPVFSFGLSHQMDFPEYSLTLDLEAFQYEFIYNDYWLDYKRDGFFVGVEHEFIPRWFINGLVGYYQDQYVLPRIKLGSCSAAPTSESTDTTNLSPTGCLRTDTGLMYQLGVYWNWTQFQRFTAYFQDVENKDPDQREYEESKQTIYFMYTMAFPSVKRVERIINRYADTAFTKSADDSFTVAPPMN